MLKVAAAVCQGAALPFASSMEVLDWFRVMLPSRGAQELAVLPVQVRTYLTDVRPADGGTQLPVFTWVCHAWNVSVVFSSRHRRV